MSQDITVPTSSREVVSIFKKYGLRPQKGRGQNFLVDRATAIKIVEAAGVEPGDRVIEIGPGLGALTLPLARRGARVLALEIDTGLFNLMQDLFRPYPLVQPLHGDALEVTWADLIQSHFGQKARVKLLSNLPYSISSPLLYRLMEQRFPFSKAVIMLQAEVARRLVSPPGSKEYGSLSVLSQYYISGTILFLVPRHLFWPRPEVESAVVSLKPRSPLLEPSQEPIFWQVVKGVFRFRRKTILNGLLRTFPWGKERALKILQAADIDPRRRPETLSGGEFANLGRLIYNESSRLF